MGNDMERLVIAWRRWRWIYLASYILWVGALILREALQPSGSVAAVLRFVGVLGGIIWAVSSWWSDHLSKRISRGRRQAGSLTPEQAQASRYRFIVLAYRSFGVTLAALMVVQAMFVAVSMFAPGALSALVVALTNILIGVSVFIGAYLHLEQKGDES